MLKILCLEQVSTLKTLINSESLKVPLYVNDLTGRVNPLHEILSGDFDLAFLEAEALPSPLNVIAELRARFPRKPVVLISQEPDLKQAVEAIKLGALDYLKKPLDPNIVWEIINKVSSNGKLQTLRPPKDDYPQIVTQDEKMIELLETAAQIAKSNTTVLIQGETGTGKEMLAKFIHANSNRQKGPYVAVNCASLPEGLAESELFGHEKGAFTGAISRKIGKFELANNGTIVLDEISEMPLIIQAKLLRTIQERQIDRVGGTKPVPVDVRIIAVSNKVLQKEVEEKRFREDLFFRINVFPIILPPLRERRGDIKLLAEHFVEKFCEIYAKDIKGIKQDAIEKLESYQWKGNVRELSNVIERAVLVCKKSYIDESMIMLEMSEQNNTSIPKELPDMTIDEMEKLMIQRALKKLNGNRTHAAKVLGISLRTLRNKLRQYREQGLIL
jgi:two-component system response regulator FlrC